MNFIKSRTSAKQKRNYGYYGNRTTEVIGEILDSYKRKYISKEDAYALIALALNNDVRQVVSGLIGNQQQEKSSLSMVYVDHFKKFTR